MSNRFSYNKQYGAGDDYFGNIALDLIDLVFFLSPNIPPLFTVLKYFSAWPNINGVI